MINGAPVIWTSKKQKSTAQSTVEAEMFAIAIVIKEVIWLRNLLTELGHPQEKPTVVYTDSRSAMLVATSNATLSKPLKHISVRVAFIREKYKNGVVNIKWINGDNQLADMLTKSLPVDRFRMLKNIVMPNFVEKEGC